MNDHSPTQHPIKKSTTEVRQGMTTGVVRRVLAISMFGAIAALAIAYWLVHGV